VKKQQTQGGGRADAFRRIVWALRHHIFRRHTTLRFADVLAVSDDPIGCDGSLGVAQREVAVANHLVQFVLERILHAGVSRAEPRLRPQVLRLCRMAAEL
jgi:hypothetical protein